MLFRSALTVNTCACFCLGISTFGTVFEHTFRIFNSCHKIIWVLDLLILVLVATSLTILRQSSSTHFFHLFP